MYCFLFNLVCSNHVLLFQFANAYFSVYFHAVYAGHVISFHVSSWFYSVILFYYIDLLDVSFVFLEEEYIYIYIYIYICMYVCIINIKNNQQIKKRNANK